MTTTMTRTNITAPTQFVEVANQTYAYRRFGSGTGLPLLCLQHFTGTPSQGGMVAQQMVLDRASVFRRMILVGTAPRGGEEIMHLEKPSLSQYFNDPGLQGYAILQKIFFAPTPSSQSAGAEFVARLALRTEDRDQASGPEVAGAQIAAFRDWEQFTGERFADLKRIRQPALVVNGIYDELIPVRNSYFLSEHLPNAMLLTYPDAGHGSLFQWHESFHHHATEFLVSNSPFAPY